MNDIIPIQYREFYDVPRIFIVAYKGTNYLFDGSFDPTLDDYPDEYKISILPPLKAHEQSGSWELLPTLAVGQLPPVQVSAVRFDQTRRQGLEQSFLDSVIKSNPASDCDELTLDGWHVDPRIAVAANPTEGWIELCKFEIGADGGMALLTQVDDGDKFVIQRRFGSVSMPSTAA